MRRGLDAAAARELADPDGVLDAVRRKRVRRRTVRRVQVAALALAVVAGSGGGAYALSKLFTQGPSGTPAAGPNSSGDRVEVTAPTTVGSPTYPYLGENCEASQVSGDFDGDGGRDIALVATDICLSGGDGVAFDAPFAIDVRWSDGAEGIFGLPGDCGAVCRAFATADLDRDGTDELLLVVQERAYALFLEVFQLPESEAGPIRMDVAPPHETEQFQAFSGARFEWGGSVTNQGSLTCRTAPSGDHLVVSSQARQSKDGANWLVRRTTLQFDPSVRRPSEGPNAMGAFVILGTSDEIIPTTDPAAQSLFAGSEICGSPIEGFSFASGGATAQPPPTSKSP